MRIYIFKSETRKELRAFAGDPMGSKLPQNHGPWTVMGGGRAASGQKDGSQNLIRPMIENLPHVPPGRPC
jgi:hypothetical protein